MRRFRTFLVCLLAVAWCSVAWHVELEALGLVQEHQHHGHAEAPDADQHAPGTTHDDHEPLLVRDTGKDGTFRLGATGLWLGLLGVCLVGQPGRRRTNADVEPVPIDGRTAPPHLRIWHFLQRCAPESAAPPGAR